MQHLRILVTGKIQGVGFRPFLVKLARQLDLAGFAMNTLQGVTIHIAGQQPSVDRFLISLKQHPPRHALIRTIDVIAEHGPYDLNKPFDIRLHDDLAAPTDTPITGIIPADRSLCRDCLEELFDPSNRRYLHPFISCIECGPRASCIQRLPFERQNTTFASFTMCQKCLDECRDMAASERRFHAQSNACHDCGPRLSLYRMQPQPIAQQPASKDDPFSLFTLLAERLRAGEIIAMKGLSGVHLLADAHQPETLARLRRIKQRPAKAFAVMALNCASLENYVALSTAARASLEGPEAPIVLLPQNQQGYALGKQLAPGLTELGCMLPTTALHYLLFYALLNRPASSDWLSQAHAPLLIVTSANLPGEPLISNNQDALSNLPGMTDWLLLHDREIVYPSDDSVLQAPSDGDRALMIRRARGFAPEPLSLHPAVSAQSSNTILACGAYLKNTFSIARGELIFPSTYLGEQNSRRAYQHYEQHIEHALECFGDRPDRIACDLHPDFFSTRYAEEYAAAEHLPLIKVAHHQAHIASVLNDAQLPVNTPFLGLALDGLGLGENTEVSHSAAPKHALWGGELYAGKLMQNEHGLMELNLEHRAHLSTLPMPGGDIASKQIARIGYALWLSLRPSTTPDEALSNLPTPLKQFIETKLPHFEHTSSLGRWFDGIASLLGLCQIVTYEGQAAMELEAHAHAYGELPDALEIARIEENGELNLYPLLPILLQIEDSTEAAARFHSEVSNGLLRWLLWARQFTDANDVLCSGGCFQNRILREQLSQLAKNVGLRLHFPQHIPVNDGSISIGQALIACLNPTTMKIKPCV